MAMDIADSFLAAQSDCYSRLGAVAIDREGDVLG